MKKCLNCSNYPLPDVSKFCSNCGSDNLAVYMPEAEKEKKKPGLLLSLLYAWLFTVLFNVVVSVTVVIYVIALIVITGDPFVADYISIDASNIVTIVGYSVFFAVVAVIFAARRKNPLKEASFFKFSPKLIPLAALFGYSANLIYSTVIGLIPWPQSIIDNHNAVYSDIGADGSNLILTILATAVFTGIAEELVFRGLVISRLRYAYGRIPAIIISALIFGLAHSTLISFTYSFILGLFLGVIFIKCNSVVPCMIVHIFFNLSACIGFPESDLLVLGMLFICIALHVLSAYLILKRNSKSFDEPIENPPALQENNIEVQ